MYDVCPWPVDAACAGDQWDDLDAQMQERALALATSALIGLTGRRVGLCPVTIRPCQPPNCSNFYSLSWGPAFMPVNWNGTWFNCGCTSGCECSSACEITIPGPVGRLDSVKVDGVELNIDHIDIQNGNILVWQGEGCPFPKTQDLSKPDSEPGTFSITYQNSYPVDDSGALAVTMLALEFAKACKPKSKCALPRGVTSVVRNGVSFEIEAGLFPNGLTGIDVTDAFIIKWMPPGFAKFNSKVFSPSMRQPRRVRTGSGGSWSGS